VRRVDGAIARASRVADLLDRAFRLPGTSIRFGLDAIIGLVPVIGDSVTLGLGLYPVLEAVRLGVGPLVVARMLLNLGIDWLIGLVPLIDIVLDVAYKANVRNVHLLVEALERKRATSDVVT